MDNELRKINVIGAGLAGLSAAKALAESGHQVRLFSVQASERAQSNLAEGGMNAALNVMGEEDTVLEHYMDTMKGGCFLADPNMVSDLTKSAPEIVMELDRLGVPFHREQGKLIQRNFGGQKKKRTVYAKSSTGKMLTCALIDAVRKYEAKGLVERYCHHKFERLMMRDGICIGVQVYDSYQKVSACYGGRVLMACGGLNGMFPGRTTGTTANTGSAAAVLFSQGVKFANLEFIQYHPTTIGITGKRLLISEAARGEGGRLFYKKQDGSFCYFMEEKFGERGNLMPRDVISREIHALGKQVYLDLTKLPNQTWQHKLSDLRDELIHYFSYDPKEMPVPVSPGIHYFMGGIHVDRGHHTNIPGLYAAGECAAAYHGANRLGGNSLLGAIYGGKAAAKSIETDLPLVTKLLEMRADDTFQVQIFQSLRAEEAAIENKMEQIIFDSLGIVRTGQRLENALSELNKLMGQAVESKGSEELKARLILAQAMLKSACERKESRGAHQRQEYPETLDEFQKTTLAEYKENQIEIYFKEIPELEENLS